MTGNVKDRTAKYAGDIWKSSPNYRDADVDRMVAQIKPAVQASQMQVAYLTNAYVGQYATANKTPWQPVAIDRDAIINYRGVDADVVYRRPAVQTYTALAKGVDYESAILQGLGRLLDIVITDLEQSANRQAQAALSSTGFEYYERVLTGAENCAFCVIASTQTYRRGNLMPIHPGCDCKTRGVHSEKAPGDVLDPDLLAKTHQAITDKFGGTDYGARDLGLDKEDASGRPLSDFTEVVVTNIHGELGPILGWRGDHFTGPGDLH